MAFKRVKPLPKARQPVLADLFDMEEPFDQPDNEHAVYADEGLKSYQEAPFKHKITTRHEWMRRVAKAVYVGVDAKEIPTKDLRIISHLSGDDPLNLKYADRIKSPTTGIRAFCINCQGGSVAGVRNCTAVSCPLYPFRMANNPFLGKLVNAEANAEDIEEPEDANQEA